MLGKPVRVPVVSEPQMEIKNGVATVFVIVKELSGENTPERPLILSRTKAPPANSEITVGDRGCCDEWWEGFVRLSDDFKKV